MVSFQVIGIQPSLDESLFVVGLKFRYRCSCSECNRSVHYEAYTESFKDEYKNKILTEFDDQYLKSLSTLLYYEQVKENAEKALANRLEKCLAAKNSKPIQEKEVV